MFHVKQFDYMLIAYKEAVKAEKKNEVPVGAIIVKNGKIIAKAHNLKEHKKDATKHAEMIAVSKASKKLKNWHLNDCEIYVTLEPCPMCAASLSQSRIKKVVFGCYDRKGGAFGGLFDYNQIKGLNHYPLVECIENQKCEELLTSFFKTRRKEKRKINLR